MDPPEVLERVRAGLALVDRVAKRFVRALGGPLEVEDSIGYGRIGLLLAARAFDPNLGFSFHGYATIRVRGAIWDAARADAGTRLVGEAAELIQSDVSWLHGLSIRSETPAESNCFTTLGVVLEVTGLEEFDNELAVTESDPEQELSNVEVRALVARWIRDLPHDQAELVRRHYWEDERLDRIGHDLGISRSWASRLHQRALKRLVRRVRRIS